MLTAFNDEEYKINAFSSLADGYMEKPFSLPVLKARIDSLIKRHYSGQENLNIKMLKLISQVTQPSTMARMWI